DAGGAWTELLEPSALKLLPLHLARPLAAMPPAVVNWPPAYRSLPDTASADTKSRQPRQPLPNPEPNADQLLPFHLAIWFAGMPPAHVNQPPAYRSLPDTASADTVSFIPEPSGDQLIPVKLAM